MDYLASMDLGGTHCRFYLENMSGECLGEFSGTGCTLNLDGYERTKVILGSTIYPALNSCGLAPEDCRGFVCAASGADTRELEQEYRRLLSEFGFNHKNILVYNDCAIFLTLCDKPALLIASGTGSILWARNQEGELYRYGGWGHLTSDEGSGFSISLKALSSVTRHLDGAEQAPVLTRLLLEETGICTPNEISAFCYKNILEKSKIAALASLVFQAAELGEPEALHILSEAAQALMNGVMILAKRTGAFSKVFLWGSLLLKSNLISDLLRGMLTESFQDIVVEVPEETALHTAINLARRQFN